MVRVIAVIIILLASGIVRGQEMNSYPSLAGFLRSGGELTSPKGISPQNANLLTDSTCSYLFKEGYVWASSGGGKQAYDTLRLLIERCSDWVDTEKQVNQAFSSLQIGLENWNTGGIGRYPEFLEYLKKVLYYEPDTIWYCYDVLDMFSAIQGDELARLAVARYIILNNRCPVIQEIFEQIYMGASNRKRQHWLDSLTLIYQIGQQGNRYQDWDTSVQTAYTQDTTLHPYDSTYGTIDDYGLSILRGPQNGVVGASSPSNPTALLGARLLENPVNDDIALTFETGREALVTMELRDILGKSVPIANAKNLLEQPGSHEVRVTVPNLPVGTYYLRLFTDTGEARTIKLVKE